MSWLRTDDGFTSHPKFEGWTSADKWAFLELMHYCARYRTGGRVPNDLTLLPRSVTAKLLDRAEQSGWLERQDETLWIHDFAIYNPKDATASTRARRYRRRKRDEDRDGDRDEERDADRDDGVTDTVTRTGPRARARARTPSRPVPCTAIDSKAVAVRGANEPAVDTAWRDRADPVVRLMMALPDADERTERVLRSFVDEVPEHAFDYTRDEVTRSKGGAGLAVTILRRIAHEGTFATPPEGASA